MGSAGAFFSKVAEIWSKTKAARRAAGAASSLSGGDHKLLKGAIILIVAIIFILFLPFYMLYNAGAGIYTAYLNANGADLSVSNVGYIYQDQMTKKEIKTAFSGTVKITENENDFTVTITDADNVEHQYQVDELNVVDKQEIQKGQILGWQNMYICPIPTEYAHGISRGYGVPTGGISASGTNQRHMGVDIHTNGRQGVPCVAVCDGTVVVASNTCTHLYPKPVINGKVIDCGCGYGNYVVINNGQDVDIYYAHLARVDVSVGDKVKQGQVIGVVGSSGCSTGYHLHLEMRNLRAGSTRESQNFDPVSVAGIDVTNHKTKNSD